MCRIGLPNGGVGIINTCDSCGADLRRFIAKPPKLPPPEALEKAAKPSRDHQMESGIAGAVGGAVLGAVLMFGFYLTAGFRFPLLGTGIGALAGLGAKKLYHATDNKLAAISAGVAALSTTGTLYLIYREVSILSILSIVASVSVAYRIVSE